MVFANLFPLGIVGGGRGGEIPSTGNVNLVLIWVKEDDEAAIGRAFRQALAVRTLSAEAKDMADMYFFETLVRMHRAGEGAPYNWSKTCGRDLGPAIPAANKALEDGSIEPVVKLLTGLVQDGVRERFQRAMDQKDFNKDKVETGREYMKTYVTFIHYVEGLRSSAESGARSLRGTLARARRLIGNPKEVENANSSFCSP